MTCLRSPNGNATDHFRANMKMFNGVRCNTTGNSYKMMAWAIFFKILIFTYVASGQEALNTSISVNASEGRLNDPGNCTDGTCVWNISAETGFVVQLAVENFDVECDADYELDVWNNCNCGRLEAYDGNRIVSRKLLFRICSSSSIIMPGLMTSTTNNMILFYKFSSISFGSFSAIYKSVNSSQVLRTCGGQISGTEGNLTTPNFPLNYSNLLTCEWFIHVDNILRIQLEIVEMDIEITANCMYDSLELRDGNSSVAPLLWRDCTQYSSSGNFLTLSSGPDLYIKFVSNWNVSSRGFYAKWKAGNIFRSVIEPEGRLSYSDFCDYGICVWNLTAGNGNVLQVAIESFSMNCYLNSDGSSCVCARLEVYDGPRTDSGSLLTRVCSAYNQSLPGLMTSSSAYMIIVLNVNRLNTSGSFSLLYKAVAAAQVIRNCTGLLTGLGGILSTPEFPNNYSNLLVCQWTIRADNGSRIQLEFIDVNIEMSPDCVYDSVEVRDGEDQSAPLLERLCGQVISPDTDPLLVSNGSVLFIKFVSNWNVTGKGFSAKWKAGNSYTHLTEAEGTVEYKDYCDHGLCVWNVSVNNGSVLQVATESFSMICNSDFTGSDCDCATLMIYDGTSISNKSLLTRVCANNVLSGLLITTLNNLVLVLNISSPDISGTMSVLYKAVNATQVNRNCGGQLSGLEGNLSTPAFPDNYSNLLICEWTIRADRNVKIELEIQDMDIVASSNCMYDSLEVRDGGNNSAPFMRRVCSQFNSPDEFAYLVSSGRQLFVKFVSDWNNTGRGFKAVWKAGNSYVNLTDPEGTIEYKGYCDRGLCTWNVTVATGSVLQIAMESFYMECFYLGENCDCTMLEIYDGPTTNKSLIFRSCSHYDILPSLVTTFTNQVIVTLKIMPFDASGFLSILYKSVNSSQVNRNCGEVLSGWDGIITSPNYPNNYSNLVTCNWIISVPSLFVIRLDIQDTDIPWSSMCMLDSLQIHDGANVSAPLLRRDCSTNITDNLYVVSTGPQIFVRFVSNWNETGRGFKVKWRRAISYFNVTDPEGTVTYPGYCENGVCIWNVTVGVGNVVQLTVDVYTIRCASPPSSVSWSECDCGKLDAYSGLDLNFDNISFSHCSENDAILPGLVTSFTNNMILIFTNVSSNTGFFSVNYKSINASQVNRNCGGQLSGSQGSITSPNFPMTYADLLVCEWAIQVQASFRIQLKIEDLDIESSKNCSYDSLQIRSGNHIYTQPLQLYCNANYKSGLIVYVVSRGSELNLKFVSNWKTGGRGFNATWSTFEGSCEVDGHNTTCDHGCAVNGENRTSCFCNVGYRLAADNQSCFDLDECSSGVTNCSNNCRNSLGGFFSYFLPGWTLNVDRISCKDIDECSSNLSGCSHNCTNTNGNFYCSCPNGFALDNGNKTCVEMTSLNFTILVVIGMDADKITNETALQAKSKLLEILKNNSILNVEVNNISVRNGSLYMDYVTVVLAENKLAFVYNLSTALIQLSGINLTMGNYTGIVSVFVKELNVNRNTTACDVYIAFSMCDNNQECQSNGETLSCSQSSTSPEISQSSTSPAISQSSTSPAISQSSTSPAISQSSTSPETSQSSTSHAISQSNTSSAISQSSSSREISQSTTSPAISQSTTSPEISQSSTSPAISQSSTSPAKHTDTSEGQEGKDESWKLKVGLGVGLSLAAILIFIALVVAVLFFKRQSKIPETGSVRLNRMRTSLGNVLEFNSVDQMPLSNNCEKC